MKKISILFLVITLLLLGSCSMNRSNDKNRSISEIYVYHYSETADPFEEYKIDFVNKEFTILAREKVFAGAQGHAVKRDSPVVKKLSDDMIEDFLKAAKKNKFADWEEHYADPDIMDGHQWRIDITFSDGTVKEISGSNAYPKTWDAMYRAFERLTGEKVLFVKTK